MRFEDTDSEENKDLRIIVSLILVLKDIDSRIYQFYNSFWTHHGGSSQTGHRRFIR
jgi:hypothetical protein